MAEKNNYASGKPATAVKKDDKKPSFTERVKKWFREMKSELKKVIWPTKKQLMKNTGVSLAVMAVTAICIWGFDEIAQLFIRALISLAG